MKLQTIFLIFGLYSCQPFGRHKGKIDNNQVHKVDNDSIIEVDEIDLGNNFYVRKSFFSSEISFIQFYLRQDSIVEMQVETEVIHDSINGPFNLPNKFTTIIYNKYKPIGAKVGIDSLGNIIISQ